MRSMGNRVGRWVMGAALGVYLLVGMGMEPTSATGGPVVAPPQLPPRPTASPGPTATPLPVYADTLKIDHQAQPSSMVAPEPVQVQISLENPAAEPIGEIRICRDNGAVVKEVGVLPKDGKADDKFSDTITPTDAQLDEGRMIYLVRYTLGVGKPGASARERAVVVPITRLPAEPGVEFTRSIPVASARPGEEVSIAYRVRNTGNVALTHLSVTDGDAGEVGALDRLDPGERKTFFHRFVMEDTFTSNPKLSYSHRATRDTFEKELAGAAIYRADERLSITLEADRSAVSPGEVVTLTYRVVNLGDVPYDHLRLTDQLMGELVGLPSEIKVGQDCVFTKAVKMTATTTFLFTLTGQSPGGSPLEAASNPLTVAVKPALDDVKLTLTARPAALRLTGPGEVDFTLTVRNEGELDLMGVKLNERERGEIRTLAVAAPGDTETAVRYAVNEPGTFQFMAELTDSKGGRLTVMSNEVAIDFGRDGRQAEPQGAPDDAPDDAPDGAPYRLSDRPAAFRQMMAGVLVVLAVLATVMAASAVSRRRHKRRLRDKQLRKLRRDYRRGQLEDGRQQTRPHPAVSAKPRQPSDHETRRPGSIGKGNGGK